MNPLTLDRLKQAGGFTAAAPVEKEIRWQHNGEDFEGSVFVRPLSYHSARSDILMNRLGGDAMAERIAYCIVDEQGAPVFTAGDITGEADPERGPMSEELTLELLRVIGEVSGLGKRKAGSTARRSTRRRSSGTSSS